MLKRVSWPALIDGGLPFALVLVGVLFSVSLPKAFLNTSAFHNVHHSHANANFGEAMYLWDVICKTRLQDTER